MEQRFKNPTSSLSRTSRTHLCLKQHRTPKTYCTMGGVDLCSEIHQNSCQNVPSSCRIFGVQYVLLHDQMEPWRLGAVIGCLCSCSCQGPRREEKERLALDEWTGGMKALTYEQLQESLYPKFFLSAKQGRGRMVWMNHQSWETCHCCFFQMSLLPDLEMTESIGPTPYDEP